MATKIKKEEPDGDAFMTLRHVERPYRLTRIPGSNHIALQIAVALLLDASDVQFLVGELCRLSGLREPDWAVKSDGDARKKGGE